MTETGSGAMQFKPRTAGGHQKLEEARKEEGFSSIVFAESTALTTGFIL